MTATIIKKQHELPMMTAIDFLGPVTGNQKPTAVSNNNNSSNNKPLPDVIRHLYNHEWKLLLEHLKQHPNDARYLMDEDVTSTSTSNNKDEYYGRTALHYACSIRNVPLQVIEALITAYPTATCYKDTTTGYYTPLHVACTLYKSSPELVRCLLQTNPQGIEAVHKRDSSYRTPLQDLIHSNEFYITRLLQRQRNKKRQRGGAATTTTTTTASSPAQLQQRKRRAGIEPTITEEEDDDDEVAELVDEEETHDHVDYLNYQDDPTFQSLWSKATYLVKAAYLGYIDDEDDDSSPIKKKKFRMLHACVSLPDCPLKLIELVLLVHPNQALQVDDDGYLPIQIVAKRHLISAIHHLKEEQQQQQQQQQQTAILANHAANAQTWTQSSMSANSPAPPYLHLTPANSMDGGMKSTSSSNIPPMTPMTPITGLGTNTPRGSFAGGGKELYLRYSRSNESVSSMTPTSSPDKKKLSSSPAVLPVLPTSPSKRHSGLSGMFSKPKLLSQKSKTISGDGSTEQAQQNSSSSPVSVTTNKHRLVVGTGGGSSSSNFDHNVQSYHSRDISNISGISMSTMGMPTLPPHIQRRYWNGTLSNPTSRMSDSHKRQSEQSMAILWLLLSLSTASKQLDHSRTKKLLKKVCESSRSLSTNKSSSSSSSSSSDNMIGPLDSQHIRRVIQDLLFASPSANGGNLSLDERTGELAMFPWMIVPMRHSSPTKRGNAEEDDDDEDVKHIDREMQQIQNHLWNAIHQSKSHDTAGGDESLLALSPKSSWESGGGYTSHTSRHHQHQRPPAVPRTNHHHHQQQQSSLSTTSHARSSPQVPTTSTETTPSSRSKSPVRAPSPSPLTNRTNHHHHQHTSTGVTIPEETAVDVAETYHKSTTNDHHNHHHHHRRHNSGSSATTSKRAEQRQDDESAASMSRQRRNRKNQVAASTTTTTTGIGNHKKSSTTTIKSIGSSSSMGASSNGSSSKLSTTTIRNQNNRMNNNKKASALPPTVPKSSGTKVPLKQSSSTTKSISSSKKSSSGSKKTATSSSSGRKHHHAF